MTESHQVDRAVLSRLTQEFDALARQMSRVSGELSQLDRLIAGSAPPAAQPTPAPTAAPAYVPAAQQQPAPYWQNYWQYWTPAAAAPRPPRPSRQYAPAPAPTGRW
ncbi:hypothetical protein [Mycobacterium asiaticum]|uniref:DUF2339 domain-containing protein n=1 Tax=Mycobacterium asiaticum TaxID=1790 RepID=A0A1A3BSV0_MYCAS|nr:hypothetical protein [Mycobacterium asiaticum]OBI76511.1 hypothetical protein A9X01_03510 [Mycobacterium asiaticum]